MRWSGNSTNLVFQRAYVSPPCMSSTHELYRHELYRHATISMDRVRLQVWLSVLSEREQQPSCGFSNGEIATNATAIRRAAAKAEPRPSKRSPDGRWRIGKPASTERRGARRPAVEPASARSRRKLNQLLRPADHVAEALFEPADQLQPHVPVDRQPI